MNLMLKYIVLSFFSLMLLTPVSMIAQQVCEGTGQSVRLRDGVKVWLFKGSTGNQAYYVPTTLRLSKNNGKPEFSYQEYTNPGNQSPDGAILHMLVTWGLTKAQMSELMVKAKEIYGENVLVGGPLSLESTRSAIKISNNSTIGRILNASLTSKGSPPITSGGKMALSFHIKKENVNPLSTAFKKPTQFAGTQITIKYNYQTLKCGNGLRVAKGNSITVIGDMKLWFG